MKTIQLPLSIITIDGQTQQRDIDTNRIEHYAQLMKDGVKFPDVEVIHDGKKYFLWDGFQRFFAAKKADVKMLSANVEKGTQRDAIWKSFSANATHGLPRGEDTIKEIVQKIREDAEWKNKSQQEIAAHIGVSRQYITKIESDNTGQKSTDMATSSNIGTKKSDTTQVTENTEVAKKSEQSPPAKSETKKEPKEALVADSAGNSVPQNLRQVFLDQQEIKDFIRQFDELKNNVLAAVKEKPKLWHYFKNNPFTTDIENLKRVLRFAVPHSVCPHCKGKGPKECPCKGAGFINLDMFKTLEKE